MRTMQYNAPQFYIYLLQSLLIVALVLLFSYQCKEMALVIVISMKAKES